MWSDRFVAKSFILLFPCRRNALAVVRRIISAQSEKDPRVFAKPCLPDAPVFFRRRCGRPAVCRHQPVGQRPIPDRRRALAAGANVNSRNRLGESALVILLKNNKVDLAQTVLAAGADINLAAINGITPLMAAAFNGQTAMAKQLLDKGADVAPLDRLQKNAMTYAAGAGSTEIVVMLLAKGVDPNTVYNNDLTALMWAAGFGKTATVKALLAAGAKPQLKDNRGKTAADMARDEHFDETATILDAAK
jgi:ankyrin repeat protein